MIVDTSAIVAVALNEPSTASILGAVERSDRLRMSAASKVELTAVLSRRASPQDQRRVETILLAWGVEITAFDSAQAEIASRAYRDFGRGSGHPAKLNMGDCFSYALAASSGEPLLFVGDDFTHTDVRSALAQE